MNTETLNIATMPIADKVQRHMMASYYAIQLDALQKEAKRLGCYFAKADTAAPIPPTLTECLASTIEYRRNSYLTPNKTAEAWEQQTRYSLEDGYAQEYLRSMMAALAALGVRLQEGPETLALLAAEECRQREVTWPRPNPEPEYAEHADSAATAAQAFSGTPRIEIDEAAPNAHVDNPIGANMSTTSKINFDAALFDEAAPETLKLSPAPIKPKPFRAGTLALTLLAGSVIGLTMTFFIIQPWSMAKPAPVSTLEDLLMPLEALPQRKIESIPSSAFCDGYEVTCIVIETDKPAETLQMLFPALPHGTAKNYRIRVSVKPLEG